MLFIVAMAGSMASASAQNYPTRPIRLLHGFAAGGAADTLSRIPANGLSKRLGQPIVIEAKPGVGGNLAATAIAKAEPDGYTIGLVTGAHAISGALYKSLAYDSVDSFEIDFDGRVLRARHRRPIRFRGEIAQGADRAR
jgi:tripartite-type tricarboxylate transporter receptor subunit TctC